jgi:hypothetical protein
MPSLVGLAVIGKKNEPLYMCDCMRLMSNSSCNSLVLDNSRVSNGSSAATRPPEPSPTTVFDNNNNSNVDMFGFVEAARTDPIHQSLPIQHQLLMHAALDRFEDLVDTTSTQSSSSSGSTCPEETGGMAIRRRAASANSSWAGTDDTHWLGLIENVGDEWQVYGHVTATNIKLFALTRRNNQDPSASKIKAFLEQVHSIYIAWIMNTFHDVRDVESIVSNKFDDGVRRAVRDYLQEQVVGLSDC